MSWCQGSTFNKSYYLHTVEDKIKNVLQTVEACRTKFDKLFGFMNTSFKPQAPQDNTQEVQNLSDTTELENALQFWKVKEKEFATLSCLVKKIFSVPATSAPIERVFSQSGKILAALRSRLKPKNLETLVFLKLNSKYIITQ